MRTVPKARKSPIAHIVHKHIRSNSIVHQYKRGRGKPVGSWKSPYSTKKSNINYDVQVLFSNGKERAAKVNTSSDVNALERGLDLVPSVGTPKTVILTRREVT